MFSGGLLRADIPRRGERVANGPFADGGERIRALSRIQRMRMQLWICGKTEFDRQGRCPAGIDGSICLLRTRCRKHSGFEAQDVILTPFFSLIQAGER